MNEDQATQWNSRRCIVLRNEEIELVMLTGGGHLASLRSISSEANALWQAPWKTVDPDDPQQSSLAKKYGGGPEGQFLAGYTGHALCLDVFGMPSQEEAANGVALHGEAAVREWHVTLQDHASCTITVELPHAGLRMVRQVSLDGAVVYVSETVENLRDVPHTSHWVQHATFGQPLIREQDEIAASLDKCVTWPLGYEGHSLLPDNTAFSWPCVPDFKNGQTVDLSRSFSNRGKGFVAAGLVPASREVGFVLARSRAHGTAVGYCFRRSDFPWVAVWEENCARHQSPWNGTAQARGMEFGTTPMPLGHGADAMPNLLFETPGEITFVPRAARQARYCIFVADVPTNWKRVTNVGVEVDGIRLEGDSAHERVHLKAPRCEMFLAAREGTRSK